MLRIVVFVLASVTLNIVDCRSRKGDIETTTENCDYSHCIDVSGNVCSDNGECNCEHCECDHQYIGKYCEHRKSAESRGDCDPKKCMDDDGDLCNNQGTCNCDSCECADSFSGPKCEIALENVNDVCKRVWKCRLCDGNTMGPGGLCTHCETVEKVRIVQVKDVLYLLERKGSHCTFYDEHSCLHNYRVSSPDVNGTRVVYFLELSMCESSTEYNVERGKSHRGDSPIEPEIGESLDSALLDSDNDGSGATVGHSGHLMRVLMFSLLTICCSIGITSF